MPIIVENAKILIKQIQKNVDQQEFNITEFMDKFTFDILYGKLFNTTLEKFILFIIHLITHLLFQEMTVGIKSRTQEKPNFFYNKIEQYVLRIF